MISIVTAVHNQIGMNRLFYETLKRNTRNVYELIIIDNNSTDGSREFFREHADTVIENPGNYSYPYCQNQGIAAARYDYLVFLNNDVLVPAGWDEHLLRTMHVSGADAISPCSNDDMESRAVQRRINTRWKYVKYPLLKLFGTRYAVLRLMKRLMYPDFERFAARRWERFGARTAEGFTGSCILLTRRVIERVGPWDERVQAADFDYFCTLKQCCIGHGEEGLRPMCVALGVYVHHYQRLTFKVKHPSYLDSAGMVEFRDKWGGREAALLADIEVNR